MLRIHKWGLVLPVDDAAIFICGFTDGDNSESWYESDGVAIGCDQSVIRLVGDRLYILCSR